MSHIRSAHGDLAAPLADWRLCLPSWRRVEAEIVKDYERKGALKDPYRRHLPAGESRTSTKGEAQ